MHKRDMMQEELLLLIISVVFTATIYFLIVFIKKFIRSRPPGRRLVTSDIQVWKSGNQPVVWFERRPGDAAERVVLGGALGDDPHGCEVFLWTHAFSCSFPCHWGLQGHYHQSHPGLFQCIKVNHLSHCHTHMSYTGDPKNISEGVSLKSC